MRTPQAGIFALARARTRYLELDVASGREPRALVTALSSLREPRTTMGGVNLVVGFSAASRNVPLELGYVVTPH